MWERTSESWKLAYQKRKKKVGKLKIHIVFISTKIVKKKFRIRKSANISIFLEKKVKE